MYTASSLILSNIYCFNQNALDVTQTACVGWGSVDTVYDRMKINIFLSLLWFSPKLSRLHSLLQKFTLHIIPSYSIEQTGGEDDDHHHHGDYDSDDVVDIT